MAYARCHPRLFEVDAEIGFGKSQNQHVDVGFPICVRGESQSSRNPKDTKALRGKE
jgi:hypothetical protein